MYSEYNHIYTNKGIYSMYDLYTLKINNALSTIKVMSYDVVNHLYKFVDVSNMTVSTELYDIYEIQFSDIYSDKISTVNGSGELYIYQYDVIKTDDDTIQSKKIKVNQYINYVLSTILIAEHLQFAPKKIQTLTNFAVIMPNISLGDTVIKFRTKNLKGKEPVYRILDATGNNIPIFVGQSVNAFYNFVLMK